MPKCEVVLQGVATSKPQVCQPIGKQRHRAVLLRCADIYAPEEDEFPTIDELVKAGLNACTAEDVIQRSGRIKKGDERPSFRRAGRRPPPEKVAE